MSRRKLDDTFDRNFFTSFILRHKKEHLVSCTLLPKKELSPIVIKEHWALLKYELQFLPLVV
jgi:hypothetical protein